jgi:small subunit ribosomal protein S12
MPTMNQIANYCRKPKRSKIKCPALERCPQKKGVTIKVVIVTPKKPNSALRKTVRIRLSNNKVVSAYVPGEGHNLQQYSTVLMRGGRVKDLPGLKYHCIRGKYDFKGIEKRKTARSKYGTKKEK